MKEKNKPHWIISEIAEQEAPGNTIDLWPQVQARTTSPSVKTQRMSIRKKQVAFGFMLALLLIGSLIFVPEARAFAEDIIQRMGIAFVDTERYEVAPQAPAEVIRVTPPPSLSMEEIRQRIPFNLMVPTWLPDDLIYVHRSISEYDPLETEGSGQKVSIEYGRTADLDFQSGILFLNANDGPISAPYVLAASRELSVTVNGVPGIYVHGGWQDDGRGDPNTKMGNLLWDDNADDAYLTWMQDGVTYLLAAHNLGLDLDDLLRIAGSMSGE